VVDSGTVGDQNKKRNDIWSEWQDSQCIFSKSIVFSADGIGVGHEIEERISSQLIEVNKHLGKANIVSRPLFVLFFSI
jgi:hypothetical protein